MPLHDERCLKCGVIEERFIPIEELDDEKVHSCGGIMERVFLKFPFSIVQPDISYESPIDGRVINSKHAREEDLARSDCVPYEPSLKSYQAKREQESEAALEKAMEQTVEAEIYSMPARKREKLVAELEGGMTADAVRITPQQESFRNS